MNIYFYFSLLFSTICFSYSDGRLVFLYTHFRHGPRGPTQLNDDYIDRFGEKWTNLGELTLVGERMLYLLGIRNRKKYIEEEGFLSEKFNPHEMLIYSMDKNRAILSCYSILQGLYPQRVNLGETLTPKQEENAYPPILEEKEVKDPYIEQAIKELKGSALPHSMMLAPTRMIHQKDIKMGIYKIGDCVEKINNFTENNLKIKELKEETEKFNEVYSEKLNKYFNRENPKFSTKELKKICSEFLSDHTDNREMLDFKEKTKIDFDVLKKDCLQFYKLYYFYGYYSDNEKLLPHVESSKIMREILFYMKRRLDADISEINEDLNYKDYSRPKLILISGHDVAVACNLVILIKALDLNMTTKFHFPRYASQIALEVRTKSKKCKNYSDYFIEGYFDNTEIFNVKVDEFINKVEKEIWTDQQVDEYCGFYEKNNDNKEKNVYKVIMIIFICLFVSCLLIIIFLVYKIYSSNHSKDLKQKIDDIDEIIS